LRDAAQILAAEVLHDDVRVTLERASEVEDRDGVRMAQATRGARFVEKPCGSKLVTRKRGMNHLHGDRSGKRNLLGAVHPPHAADTH